MRVLVPGARRGETRFLRWDFSANKSRGARFGFRRSDRDLLILVFPEWLSRSSLLVACQYFVHMGKPERLCPDETLLVGIGGSRRQAEAELLLCPFSRSRFSRLPRLFSRQKTMSPGDAGDVGWMPIFCFSPRNAAIRRCLVGAPL